MSGSVQGTKDRRQGTSPDTIATLSAALVIVAFLWNLHHDLRAMDARIGKLAERIARLEGQVQTMAGHVQMLMQVIIDRERGPGETTT